VSIAGWSQAEFATRVQELMDRSRLAVLVRQLQEGAPRRGTGDPNGVIVARPGALYVNLADGKLWVHEDAATSNTGWAVK
jgi:hypothetical protein